MSLTVSTPVKILALVGVLGALALGAGFTLLGKSPGSEAPAKVIKPLHPRHKLLPATAAPAKPKPVAIAKHKPAVAAKPKTSATAGPKPKPVAVEPKPALPPLPQNGLPAVINRALQMHAVVVVSLYDPQADVDAASLGEAAAGAELAGAGFVPLNVLSQAQAAPLAKKLGVLPDPALLVFRAPDELVFRVNGFADRDTVAQAVENALPTVTGAVDWRIQANQICAAAGGDPAQLNALRALNVPAASATGYQAFLSKYSKLLTGPAARRTAAAAPAASSASALGLTDCTGRAKP
jgi:hypothetical protein